ncbi:deoxyribose-phosphate aldolase [Altibacter sp.]|uniref:deoxyribose-phosphate aldolase n=1 Tax=Altibacter sp. TaxID=2024823 RepID=UPI0025886404|nr:deoxyribose-phosphate aldolase [Altibacter sp.]MCW9036683.1 deoxyribose-phosphate aldolase [Altibacter sp.]
MELQRYIDHTLLSPTATPEDVVQLCEEAKKYHFYAVCVNSCYVFLASNELLNTPVKVAATVGFPLGAASSKSKRSEAKRAIKDGAHEIDMVMNLGLLKAHQYKSVREEITAVKESIGEAVLKVIIETCFLTDEEKRIACNIAVKAGAQYVKTSTGFGTGGATRDDVALMLEEVGPAVKVKASGGIKDAAAARAFITLGASRIGTSSGIAIVSET